MLALEIGPELRTHAEKGAEGDRGFGADGTLALDDFVDGGAGDSGALRQLGLRQAESVEELFLEDASRGGTKDGGRGFHGC